MSRTTVSRLLALIVAGLITGSTTTEVRIPRSPSGEETSASLHEARLRKLHLVRPDLINYPIAFDVIC